ncbi:hypothetical protein [Oxalicibacterium faecigallinarum]|uniref:Uncharacterized protein n=1 Tax=Oxalicibacterium faecigallinarum TaxID=573741 RepID=A0A8J3B0D7_9BURK|nr:hypothetical protein [Oxalicibacterium faecigallinarum]GGI21449.1 hypothetical protein GCM10008066_29120 [Oxalicibacterium faecigallinarum]
MTTENEAAPAPTNKPWQKVVAFLILAVALMYYPLSNFFNFSISFGDNTLEKALYVGKSTKDQFANFMDKGGLSYESSWKGYKAMKVNVHFHDNEKLAIAQIQLDKKPIRGDMASIANLKRSLSSECGSEWVSLSANQTMIQAKKNGVECALHDQGGQTEVILIKREP